ncbi:MAG: hypothetical protein IJK28_12300 [Clostridia bacterium]|nr:hypothetical protein [Clostridia bacterium]
MKYSKPYKRGKRTFRYRYDTHMVQCIDKPDTEMIADNVEWRQKYGRDLWEIESGYLVIDAAGLMLQNWKNKESRDEYLDIWSYELDEESAYLVRQYIMYG